MTESDYRFEVAISFAGDNKRAFVREIAERLRAQLGDGKVFFDEWFEAELAGPDAHVRLQRLYGQETRLVVSCICERYNEKPWTQEEWRAIQAFERTLRDAGTYNAHRLRFLPLRFGDGEVDGLFSTAIVPDVRQRSVKQVADLILKRLRLATEESEFSESTDRKQNELVLLVHSVGEIRWQEMVAERLSADNIQVKPIRFRPLNRIQFVLPGPSRRRAIDEVRDKILGHAQLHTGLLSVIAHSFGTYAVLHVLIENPELHLHRLVLCGSVIPEDFKWSRLSDQIDEVVINECGTHDPWPVLAQAFSWGYGASGRFGFGSPGADDRFHEVDHHGFLTNEFVDDNWVPLFHDNRFEKAPTNKPTAGFWINRLRSPFFRWGYHFLLIVFVILAANGVGLLSGFTMMAVDVDSGNRARQELFQEYAAINNHSGSSAALHDSIRKIRGIDGSGLKAFELRQMDMMVGLANLKLAETAKSTDDIGRFAATSIPFFETMIEYLDGLNGNPLGAPKSWDEDSKNWRSSCVYNIGCAKILSSNSSGHLTSDLALEILQHIEQWSHQWKAPPDDPTIQIAWDLLTNEQTRQFLAK